MYYFKINNVLIITKKIHYDYNHKKVYLKKDIKECLITN